MNLNTSLNKRDSTFMRRLEGWKIHCITEIYGWRNLYKKPLLLRTNVPHAFWLQVNFYFKMPVGECLQRNLPAFDFFLHIHMSLEVNQCVVYLFDKRFNILEATARFLLLSNSFLAPRKRRWNIVIVVPVTTPIVIIPYAGIVNRWVTVIEYRCRLTVSCLESVLLPRVVGTEILVQSRQITVVSIWSTVIWLVLAFIGGATISAIHYTAHVQRLEKLNIFVRENRKLIRYNISIWWLINLTSITEKYSSRHGTGSERKVTNPAYIMSRNPEAGCSP